MAGASWKHGEKCNHNKKTQKSEVMALFWLL
jgi:hypothetical protein